MLGAESLSELAASLTRNKLRTLLTALGVFWGIFVLVLMLGMGRGLERGVEKNLGVMATRSVFVWGQRTSLPFRGLTPGRNVRFANADIETVKSVPGVQYVSPRIQLGEWRDGANVTAGIRSGYFPVLGDVPEYLRVEPVRVQRGRFVNRTDVDEARKVAVIGQQAREILFGERDPIGQYLSIRGVYFQVVGEVTSTQKGEPAERIRTAVFVPFTTFQQAFNRRDKVGWFALGAHPDASPEVVETAVKRALAERHRIHPDDQQAIGAWNSAKQYDRVHGLFRGIRGFVWFVGTMTLLAGVLGVSNILLISVKERTREIGVRKALGATPLSVISMVIKEAVVLTSLSGYLGLIAGVGALEALAAAVARLDGAPINRPDIDVGAALLATLVLVVAGAIAGVVPARHAARISPVEALRSE
jgi:putative ABC transport system permease protein